MNISVLVVDDEVAAEIAAELNAFRDGGGACFHGDASM